MAGNLVPRVNEAEALGTTLKRWLKGWFKDLFVSGDITDGTNTVTVAELKTVTAGGGRLVVVDEKPGNTGGGTFTSGAWRTRDLNTVIYNSIDGASLASNQITLPIGIYYIEADAPCWAMTSSVQDHKIKLRRITASAANILIGTSAACSDVTPQTRSFFKGVFEIAEEVVFELQHITNITSTTYGFGMAYNTAIYGVDINIYSQVSIQKIG